MESIEFSWRWATPEEVAVFEAAEPMIAGFRIEPNRIVLRVGERNRLFPVRIFALDEFGRDIQQISGRYDGVADPTIAEYVVTEGLVAVREGRTAFLVTPGLRTREGDRPPLKIEIEVRPA